MYCIVNCIYLFVFPIVADMESIVCFTRPRLLNTNIKLNKTKVVRADLQDLYFDLDNILKFGNISVLATFQFW